MQAISTRLVRETGTYSPQILCAADAVLELQRQAIDWDKEHFMVLMLDGSGHPIGLNVASVGTANQAPAHAREVFKAAIVANACSIIVLHNHPSGDITPSDADKSVTSNLGHIGDLIGIKLLDSIILGNGQSYSIATERVITQ